MASCEQTEQGSWEMGWWVAVFLMPTVDVPKIARKSFSPPKRTSIKESPSNLTAIQAGSAAISRRLHA
eukprot:2324560-Amphidinium_carterae.1